MKFLHIKIFIITSFIISFLNSHAQVNAEQVMTIGRNVLSMEDYLLSIQYFNLAIKAKPYLADAYFYRALAKLNLEDYEGAVKDCNLALQRNKFKSEAYKVRGFALINLQKDSLAIEDFNKGLQYNPDDRYFLFYKGIAQTELKKFNDADSTFSYLLRRHPNFEDGYVAAGRMELLRGDTIKGIENIDKALKISRSLINAYLLKAEIGARRADWPEALENMDEAIKLRPEESDFYVNRAYLRYNNEDFFGAMSDYNYSLQLQPDNTAALFNRALLRTQVKELSNAEKDFTRILELEPDNFYALYNRGLVNLELENYKASLEDFKKTVARYPKFYPAYYAMAECYRNLDNIPRMAENIKIADRMIANYVNNPQKNPLDRPVISSGRNITGHDSDSPETEEEFMERFNQLQTNSGMVAQELSFNDKIKGRVQDRNINISPEGTYFLSFFPPEMSLKNLSNYFRELDNINRRQYISRKLYLRQDSPLPSEEESISKTFAIEEDFNKSILLSDNPRPIDLLGRGLARMMLKNYDEAIADITSAIEGADNFIPAIFARSNAYYLRYKAHGQEDKSSHRTDISDITLALMDLDRILSKSPDMIYGWYNKGLIYYETGDFTSAIQCFTEALELDPEFGQAYYNRGLAYMNQANRNAAFSDLSKAGELGVLPSYNLLKRMK